VSCSASIDVTKEGT
jgi:hypothetical protein